MHIKQRFLPLKNNLSNCVNIKNVTYYDNELITNFNTNKRLIYYINHGKALIIKNDIDGNKIISKDKAELDKFLSYECKVIFNSRLERIKPQFDYLPEFKLRIRKMTSRWGVCNIGSMTVTLNSELIKKDVSLIDYVIIHELCHFKHMNHGTEYWKEVEKYYPYHKMARKMLKESQND